jgi:hypothetical protein
MAQQDIQLLDFISKQKSSEAIMLNTRIYQFSFKFCRQAVLRNIGARSLTYSSSEVLLFVY